MGKAWFLMSTEYLQEKGAIPPSFNVEIVHWNQENRGLIILTSTQHDDGSVTWDWERASVIVSARDVEAMPLGVKRTLIAALLDAVPKEVYRALIAKLED